MKMKQYRETHRSKNSSCHKKDGVFHIFDYYVSRVIMVTRALPSLHKGSLKITITVSLSFE